jgi:CheY-like chemotaxis protein
MSDACTSLQPMLRRLVGDRAQLEFDCPDDGMSIRIDPGQFEQVVFNLVLNSRDASPSGSIIKVATFGVDDDPAPPEVAIAVTDHGSGMDADTRARCLEPFFTTKGRRGIGLGLATVHTIVQRAGGRLEIDSEPGRGTTVTAVFPRSDAAAVTVERGTRREHASVLLVDDDELIRRYASTVLTDAGFEVTTVGSGEAAVQAMSTNGGFDLLISDIVMPGMSGFDLARRVGDQWPGVARLLMTGYAGTDTSGTDLADVVVLPKPFAGDDLVRAANDALS